jgi:hypothetical protein
MVMRPSWIPAAKMDIRQRCRKFHILDILTAYEKQLSNGFVIVVFTAHPFQQDKARQYKECTAYGQVIAYPVEFLPKFQKGFAVFETAFDVPVVPITSDNLTGRQAAVC